MVKDDSIFMGDGETVVHLIRIRRKDVYAV